jgi:hypothetical protein
MEKHTKLQFLGRVNRNAKEGNLVVLKKLILHMKCRFLIVYTDEKDRVSVDREFYCSDRL